MSGFLIKNTFSVSAVRLIKLLIIGTPVISNESNLKSYRDSKLRDALFVNIFFVYIFML